MWVKGGEILKNVGQVKCAKVIQIVSMSSVQRQICGSLFSEIVPRHDGSKVLGRLLITKFVIC